MSLFILVLARWGFVNRCAFFFSFSFFKLNHGEKVDFLLQVFVNIYRAYILT